MQFRHSVQLLLLVLASCSAGAQAIDNSLSFKNINSDAYFRLNYENDFFSATDIYYTQGIHIELVTPWLRRFPLCRLLVHPRNFSYVRYGIGFEHEGYTPTSYSNPSILYGDRPYAACLFMKTFLIAIDPTKKQRFSSSFSASKSLRASDNDIIDLEAV